MRYLVLLFVSFLISCGHPLVADINGANTSFNSDSNNCNPLFEEGKEYTQDRGYDRQLSNDELMEFYNIDNYDNSNDFYFQSQLSLTCAFLTHVRKIDNKYIVIENTKQ